MKALYKVILFFLFFTNPVAAQQPLFRAADIDVSAPGITPENLRCEYRVEPRGVDASLPRLSWTVASAGRAQWQSAYQILLASTPARLDANQADLWDSGKVASLLLHRSAEGG